jgi:hypothetical protein
MTRRFWWFAVLWPALLSAQESLPHGFAVARDVSLRIWLPAGTVRLETWDRDSIRVTGSAGKGARYFGGGAGHAAKLGVDNIDPKVTTLAQGNLVVTVPRNAHVWIKMTDGAVVASGTTGEIEVITVAGSVTVQDAAGVVSVETIDAKVSLARINGAVRARTGGGPLTLQQIQGTLTATTVGGTVDLTGTPMQDSRIESIGGGITVRGTVAPDAMVTLDTHSGPITLVLDPAALPALGLSSRSGSISNPLGKGNSSAGRIVAHSFKGAISVSGHRP